MDFNLDHSLDILKRTPDVLMHLLESLPPDWSEPNEGENTWSPRQVVGHLVHGEKTDWFPRIEKILADEGEKTFTPFERDAHLKPPLSEESLNSLLGQFKWRRMENVGKLLSLELSEDDLKKTGRHPDFGTVSMAQLLATWVAHDLTHLNQISRVMAKQYDKEVGPWKAYLGVLNR